MKEFNVGNRVVITASDVELRSQGCDERIKNGDSRTVTESETDGVTTACRLDGIPCGWVGPNMIKLAPVVEDHAARIADLKKQLASAKESVKRNAALIIERDQRIAALERAGRNLANACAMHGVGDMIEVDEMGRVPALKGIKQC